MSPLAADLSDLPRGNADTRTGLVPDDTPRFIGVLADAWATVHDDYKPTAGGTRFRHSDSGKCARAISYTAAGIPRSDPMDLTGVWNVTLGSLLHDAWQKALLERYPDAEVEVKCGWDDLDASGHIDAVIRVPWEETDDDPERTAALLAEGQAGPGDGVLGVDSGHARSRVLHPAPRRPQQERGGAPTELRDLRGSDPGGSPSGSPLSEPAMRESAPRRTSVLSGKYPAGGESVSEERDEDSVSEGSPVRGDEPSHKEERSSSMSDVPERIHASKTIVYELKTIGGFGYKSAIGKARRGTPADGPRAEHILQAALSGLAIDADEIVIGYLAKECISMNAGAELTELGRFACEWTLTRDQFEPLALEEKARIAGILALVDDGMLAARKVPGMPPGAEIVDVATSRWEQHDHDGTLIDTDTLWGGSFCSYCSFHTLCANTGPGRIPVISVDWPGLTS